MGCFLGARRLLKSCPACATPVRSSTRPCVCDPAAYIMTRWAQQADTVSGYDIPAQSALVLCPYITHHLPEFWPDPERFDPERFATGAEAERPRYAYLPFGGGPRQCIGNSFALTEATLITAAIVQRFRIRVQPNHPGEMDPQITLRMKDGLPARLEERT